MHPIIKFVPNALSSKLGRAILLTQKNSPTILFAGGVVGVIATTVVASRASLQLSDKLEAAKINLDVANKLLVEQKEEYTEQDYRKDVAVVYAKAARDITRLYAPAIGVGVISIACLTGSHHILKNRNLALAAAYSSLEKGFFRYRQRVIDHYGEELDRELRYDMGDQVVTMTTDDGKQFSTTRRRVEKTVNEYSIYARFFDQLCSPWQKTPEYNFLFLRAQQNYANDLLLSRGHVFLNEVYDMLGLERSKPGAVVGWVLGAGDNYVDFGIFDGTSSKAIDFVNGREGSILLDFNVDGVIYDKI